MVITYPYPVAFLADILPIASVIWDIRRSDEMSGVGDGRIWQAELADPLWTAEVTLDADRHNAAKQIAAKIRQLHGARESFFLFDPLSLYPQADPKGVILGASEVQIHTRGGDNASLRLKGLPVGYVLTIGDKGQVSYSSAPARNFFFEVSETVEADGDGITPAFSIFPNLPAGVAVDDPVNLAKPACKGFIMPGSHHPGTAAGSLTKGAAFTFMERRR